MAFAQQPAPQAKPSAENQKLAAWYGEWTYEGTCATTPLGPGYQFIGKMTGRPVLGGFAGEFTYVQIGPAGETRYLEIDFWDPVANALAYIFLGDDGDVERGFFTIKGGVTTDEGVLIFEGKLCKTRGTETIATDGQSFTRKYKLCADGKTWLPYIETKYTKATPAMKYSYSGEISFLNLPGIISIQY